MRKPFIAGNWKMYKTTAEAVAFAEAFCQENLPKNVDAAIFAPYLQLEALKKAFAGTKVRVGAQNVHFAEEGAYTGEISPRMLKELGIDLCIVGHSERRQYFGETDETVNRKLLALRPYGIRPVLCVGESLETRERGEEESFVKAQLRADLSGLPAKDAASVIIAYEPIWAIGTGLTAKADDAESMCKCIRETVKGLYDAETADALTVLYGGSVKPANIAELMEKENIDGALVGGASLTPDSFSALVNY